MDDREPHQNASWFYGLLLWHAGGMMPWYSGFISHIHLVKSQQRVFERGGPFKQRLGVNGRTLCPPYRKQTNHIFLPPDKPVGNNSKLSIDERGRGTHWGDFLNSCQSHLSRLRKAFSAFLCCVFNGKWHNIPQTSTWRELNSRLDGSSNEVCYV